MIKHYQIELCSSEKISASLAYLLYSILMEKLDPNYADFLHEQRLNPISQNLEISKNKNHALWRIHLFSQESTEYFSKILDELSEIHLRSRPEQIRILSKHPPETKSLTQFIREAAETDPSQFAKLYFYSPASFKINGEYQFFPSVEHIIKNLIVRWNTHFQEYSLADEDMEKMLIRHIRISGYQLQSRYFDLKKNKIPGFCGQLHLRTTLPPPLMEIWKLLLHFACCSGIGIKTSLGMGGVRLLQDSNNPK